MTKKKILIVVSRYNELITKGLEKTAMDFLSHHIGFERYVTEAPGAFEIPVIIENMMAIGDALGIKYNSGLEDDAKLMSDRDSLANRSIMKLRQEKDMPTKPVEKEPMPMKEEKPMGLMSRREE